MTHVIVAIRARRQRARVEDARRQECLRSTSFLWSADILVCGKKMQKKVGEVTDKVIDKVEEGVENVQGVFRKIASA